MQDKQFSQEVKDFAAAIHQLTCNANHVDQCGWVYGEEHRKWEYERVEKLYFNQLLEIVTPYQLQKIADILRPGYPR